jgi:hypothetical protein
MSASRHNLNKILTEAMESGDDSMKKMRITFLIEDVSKNETSGMTTSQLRVKGLASPAAKHDMAFHFLFHSLPDRTDCGLYQSHTVANGLDQASTNYHSPRNCHHDKIIADPSSNQWPKDHICVWNTPHFSTSRTSAAPDLLHLNAVSLAIVEPTLPDSLNALEQDYSRSIPLHSVEEKLFIMHHRILERMDWPDICQRFEVTFGTNDNDHSAGGLASAYYCIRQEWDMKLVTETNSGVSQGDQAIVLGREVKHKAKHGICLWDHQW